MTKRDSSDVPGGQELFIRRWLIPSFLVRNYQFGYERECHDLMFSGENRKGAREEADEDVVVPDIKNQ